MKGEASCAVCGGDWASAREERAAEQAYWDCASRLRQLARLRRELAESQEEPAAAEREAQVAHELEAAAAAIKHQDRAIVPICPSCG